MFLPLWGVQSCGASTCSGVAGLLGKSGLALAAGFLLVGAQLSCSMSETHPTATGSVASDVGASLDPERNIVLSTAGGDVVLVTAMKGAEDGEALSPDGRRVAFVGGDTGLASVWVAWLPLPGQPPSPPIQLTNVGLERAPRLPGQPPTGYVPVPDVGRLRWDGNHRLSWRAGGVAHGVDVP